jgi:hypothetical protein
MAAIAPKSASLQSTMPCLPPSAVADLIRQRSTRRQGVVHPLISKVTVQNIKRLKAPTVLKPEGVTILAGGNNGGKSTLLLAGDQ